MEVRTEYYKLVLGMKKLMKLLLIDDNKDITTMFSKYFTQKGHPCTVCNNSHNALDMITTGQYDIVLLDLAMPEVSGTDIVDALYQGGKIGKLNIIALTASSVSSEKEEELKKKGVNGVLKKPIDPDELLDYLQQTHTKLINR